MTTTITVAQLSELIQKFPPAPCWQFRRYLGSMLCLDFGERVGFMTRDSTMVQAGSFMIGIRNVFWVAVENGSAITDSGQVDSEIFNEELRMRPVGALLECVAITADGLWMIFQFDNGFALRVDVTNTWLTEGELLEITLPDGRLVGLTVHGTLQILDEIEPVRAQRWRTRSDK